MCLVLSVTALVSLRFVFLFVLFGCRLGVLGCLVGVLNRNGAAVGRCISLVDLLVVYTLVLFPVSSRQPVSLAVPMIIDRGSMAAS